MDLNKTKWTISNVKDIIHLFQNTDYSLTFEFNITTKQLSAIFLKNDILYELFLLCRCPQGNPVDKYNEINYSDNFIIADNSHTHNTQIQWDSVNFGVGGRH